MLTQQTEFGRGETFTSEPQPHDASRDVIHVRVDGSVGFRYPIFDLRMEVHSPPPFWLG